jgi:hypothetical protein
MSGANLASEWLRVKHPEGVIDTQPKLVALAAEGAGARS